VSTNQGGTPPAGGERWIPSQDVVAERTGDRVVLIHMQTNKIFELNSTGARVWELLNEGEMEDGIVRRMSEEFDVEDERLRQEVRTLLRRLSDEKMVATDG
jgi:hypothetical protein